MIVGLASAMITIMASLQAAKANLDDLQLQGMGTLRWMGLKVYEARLFASTRPSPAQLTQLPLRWNSPMHGISMGQASLSAALMRSKDLVLALLNNIRPGAVGCRPSFPMSDQGIGSGASIGPDREQALRSTISRLAASMTPNSPERFLPSG